MTTKITQKITPFLWFDDKAEEAAKFYASIFKNSKVGKITRYDEEAAGPTGRPAGSVMTVEFELEGQEFVALNGGPMFKFSEAISFVVNCETQEEVDYFWSKLSAGGEESRLRLAQGQIRFVVAGRSRRLNRNAGGQGRRKSKARYARDAANGQDRYPNAEEGIRWKIGERDSLKR